MSERKSSGGVVTACVSKSPEKKTDLQEQYR